MYLKILLLAINMFCLGLLFFCCWLLRHNQYEGKQLDLSDQSLRRALEQDRSNLLVAVTFAMCVGAMSISLLMR